MGLDSKFLKDRARDDGEDRARVDEKRDLPPAFRIGGICDFEFQAAQSHYFFSASVSRTIVMALTFGGQTFSHIPQPLQ